MSVTALPDARARELTRIRVDRLLLALSACAGAVSVLKGLAPGVVDGSEYYWLLGYDHGFIRRGLIGTLVRPLLRVWSFEQLKPAITIAHIVACLWIIFACYRLFSRAVNRETRGDVRLVLTLSFLFLMCSQLMPTLAHDVGYVDVYILSLALGCFWLVLDGRYLTAGSLAAAGPFVHEAFVFVWAPVAILLVASAFTRPGNAGRKLAAAVLPLVATAVVVLLHSESAVQRAVEAAPMSEIAKGPLIDIIYGQTLASAFRHMMRYDFRDDLPNFFTSMAYFLPPTLALLWAAVFAYGRRWAAGWGMAVVGIAATVCPLAVVAIAWDLSRFLVWSTFAAAIALIGLGTPSLVAMKEAA